MSGEPHSAETVPLKGEDDEDGLLPSRSSTKVSDAFLKVRRNGVGSRRSSGASSISGFTSGGVSD